VADSGASSRLPFGCAGRAVRRRDRATFPAARAALCSSRYLSSARQSPRAAEN